MNKFLDMFSLEDLRSGRCGETVSPTSSFLISSLSFKHLKEEDTLKQEKNINLKGTQLEIVM